MKDLEQILTLSMKQVILSYLPTFETKPEPHPREATQRAQ